MTIPKIIFQYVVRLNIFSSSRKETGPVINQNADSKDDSFANSTKFVECLHDFNSLETTAQVAYKCKMYDFSSQFS